VAESVVTASHHFTVVAQ